MCKKPKVFLCVKKLRFLNVSKRSVSNVSTFGRIIEYSRWFAGATTGTTGAMQLTLPACGDKLATQRTHGHALYVKLTPPTSVRARIAPVVASFGAADTFASIASNT